MILTVDHALAKRWRINGSATLPFFSAVSMI
jgi:hypothetical protein